jgi:hypothetical protein
LGAALCGPTRGRNGLGGDRLYENISSDGTNWGGWGFGLDTVSISTAPLAYTPDNFAINLFLRRQDGELVHKRFDGANWQSIQDLNMKAR